MRSLYTVIPAAVLASGAGGQAHDMSRFDTVGKQIKQEMIQALFSAEDGSSNYAMASIQVMQLEDSYANDQIGSMVYPQIGASWMAITSRYDEALDTFGGMPAGMGGAKSNQIPLDLETAPSSIEAIVDASAGHRVVMLNEGHHVGAHRAYARRLLEPLRDAGFTHLAAEAFKNEQGEPGVPFVNDATRHGYPTLDTGFYTKDPMFGEFIRCAQELGFILVPYEVTTKIAKGRKPADSINPREQAQFDSLKQVLTQDDNARVLVYCGYAHLAESPVNIAGDQVSWLGCLLKQKLGVDPLTISQTQFTPGSSMESVSSELASAMQHYDLQDVSAFRNGHDLWSSTPSAHDITLVHPFIEHRYGRPGWMSLSSDLAPVDIKEQWLAPGGRSFIQAIHAGEDAAIAVPADQCWINASDDRSLLLRAGDYLIRTYNSEAVLVSERAISVE